MPALVPFDYGVIRVMPRVERGEFINVGVIVFCRTKRFLQARLAYDEHRLHTFAPALEWEPVLTQLSYIPQICEGGAESGPIGAMPLADRFYWLTAPRSTVIQCSPIHSGLCSDPTTAIVRLMERMVG